MKIKLYVHTGFANASHFDTMEIPDDEWNALAESEREKLLDEYAQDFMANCIECGAYPVEEGESDED